MQDQSKQVQDLMAQVDETARALGIEEKSKELINVKEQIANPDFWQDQIKAKTIMQKQSQLETQVSAWNDLMKSLSDLQELSKMGDETLADDIGEQLGQLIVRYDEMKQQLAYQGPYDHSDVILNIYAGAGGTDAQDWAQMLMRMYLRYAEKASYKTKVLDESSGEEAGIKSATLQISGDLAYGKLKGEAGVHRLVRLSPFNSDNLRQTSFAKVDILPKIDKPEEVEIDEKDLKVDVFRAGGHGGQSVNTTDSAVRVTHLPTGITVSIQNERSQIQNKETAMTILRSRLAALQLEQHKEKISELKGPNQANEWGSQIRNYVLHPYKQVKDLRTKYESSDPDKVLDGDLDAFIEASAKSAISLK